MVEFVVVADEDDAIEKVDEMEPKKDDQGRFGVDGVGRNWMGVDVGAIDIDDW